MPVKKCLLPTCTNRESAQFIRVPRNEQMRQVWKNILLPYSPRLSEVTPGHFRCMYVCERHFEKKYLNVHQSLRFKRFPTLFSDEEISTGTPAQLFRIEHGQGTDPEDHNYTFVGGHNDHNYARNMHFFNNGLEVNMQACEKAPMGEEISNQSKNYMKTCDSPPNFTKEMNAESEPHVTETRVIKRNRSRPRTLSNKSRRTRMKVKQQKVKLKPHKPNCKKVAKNKKAPEIDTEKEKLDVLAEFIVFNPADDEPETDEGTTVTLIEDTNMEIQLNEDGNACTGIEMMTLYENEVERTEFESIDYTVVCKSNKDNRVMESRLTNEIKKFTDVELKAPYNTGATQTESEPISFSIVCKPNKNNILMESKLRKKVTGSKLKETQSSKKGKKKESIDMENQLRNERQKVTILKNLLRNEFQKVTILQNQLRNECQKVNNIENQLRKEQQKVSDMESSLENERKKFIEYNLVLENNLNFQKNKVKNLMETNKSLREEIKQRNAIQIENMACIVEDIFLY